jgi:hypothetical protein
LSSGLVNALGTSALFSSPGGIAFDSNSASPRIFICDTSNHRVAVVTVSTRSVSTFSGQGGLAGWVDAPSSGLSSRFSSPEGIAQVWSCAKRWLEQPATEERA